MLTSISDEELECMPCPLGCSANDMIVLTGADLLHGLPGQFTVVECKECGLRRTDPRPRPGKMSAFYPPDYGPFQSTHVTPSATNQRKFSTARSRGPLARIFGFNTQCIPKVRPGNMLEVGCASGSFLARMAQGGWNVNGIEPSRHAARLALASGYQVQCNSLEGAELTESTYDLVVAWMAIEHLHEPVQGLRRLRFAAREGAWLCISVPNVQSLDARLFQNRWYGLQLPTHLYHYDRESIEKVLAKSGWRLKKVFYHKVMTDTLVSLAYVLDDLGFRHLSRKLRRFAINTTWIHYALYPFAFLLSAFGFGARMTVWARAE